MGKKKWLNIFTALLIAGMIFGGYLPRNVTAQVPTPEPELPLAPGGEGVTADPLAKVDSELRTLAAAGGETPVQVYILAKEGADLSRVATVTETRPFPDGAQLVVATVLPSQIEKLASHPDVVAAEAFHAIEAPIPLTPKEDATRLTPDQAHALRDTPVDELEKRELPAGFKPAARGQITAVDDWNGASLIGAPEAWAKGYTGEDVNIAIIDSGIDFGHPDLENNIAFYEDGPYAGWPIALDPFSMRGYFYEGYTSWDNYYDYGNYSWYADVDDVIFCAGGSDEVFYFNEEEFTIAQEWVDMSLSGEIRWGVHPDYQLYNYVYDWVPFILIDTAVAGVYDTVIADLNFDYWFDEYDDTAVLGADDPVLNQDIGSYVYTNTVVMTGTAYVPSGLWWYPPLWYGYNLTAGEETLPAGSFIYAKTHDASDEATDGADGIPEVSGGMVYFIADGNLPVPGMDYLYPGIGPAGMDPIPLNGQLVAFMLGSDYAGGGDHGTLCASAAAAGGQIKGYFGMFGEFVQYDPEDWSSFFDADDISEWLPWLKAAGEGTVQGAAPGAKLIAVGDNYGVVNGMQGFYDAYTFLAFGVDGAPNTGDEFVDIASMSYGDGTVHNDGWDWESRLLEYYNRNYLPNTTMFQSSGNGGPGYGTVNSPGGSTAVSVGASTQYGASTAFGSAISAEQINDGEVVHFSGRGPDAMGGPDPEVVATGGWGAGDGPLNMTAIYNYTYGGWFPGDGNNAWYEWGGTSRSAPEAAGVMATIYQAYAEANGEFPDFETARQIMMGGAQDLNHDVLRQGAGRVNADTGTDIAAGLGGVYVSPNPLAAGEYKGTQYESFANLLFPGDTWTQTFTVTNPGAAPATVALGDEALVEIETQTFDQVVRPYLGTEDSNYLDPYYYYAHYFVTADPSLTVGYAFVRVAHASPGTPPVEVCVDGGVAFQDAPFGAVTGYAALPPGEYFVEVFPAFSDCTGTAVISATLNLAPFTDYTVVATDFPADITPVVLVDDNSEPEEGNAHVRLFHAVPDAPAVDVVAYWWEDSEYISATLFTDVAFQDVTSYLPVEGDTYYDLEVRISSTDTVLLYIPANLEAGQVYTIFAMGGAPAALPETVSDGSLNWLYQDTVGVAVSGANSGQELAYPAAYQYTPASPAYMGDILVYTDDFIHVAPDTYLEQALRRLGLPATVYVNGDYAGFQAALNSGGWELVLVASENYFPPSTLTSDLYSYVASGGKLAMTFWDMLDYSADSLWSLMGFDYIANDLTAPPVFWWESDNPILSTPNEAPEWLVRNPVAALSDGQYLDPTADGLALGGYTAAPATDQASLILNENGRTTYKGFLDATFDQDSDADGVPDGVELWENIIVHNLLTGVIERDTPLPARPVNHGPDLAITVPEGADFMEVEVTVPFELFDYCYDDPWPDSICYGDRHRYSLTVFDWTDRNADDILWFDGNGDEVVSTSYGDYVEVTAASWVTQTELNRFNYAYNHANIQGATVRLGDRDDIDNIVLGLVHNQPNNARSGEDFYEANPLQVKVVFYEKVDWPIVETSAASLTVPAGGEATFDATFTIPDDPTLYGLHQGAITVGEAVIPTTVNVAVPSEEMLFTLGGNEDSGTPYDNSKMGPGYTWSGVLEQGDWRFYYYDAETGLDQQYLYVRNQWGDICGNMPTFNETLVWGPNFGDQFSLLDPVTFGPYGNQFAGGTDWANTGNPFGWGGPRIWAGWYDGDDIPQPESRAWATLWDGLNQVQFRNVLMSGKHSCGEGFEATAGVFGVDAHETGIIINTDQTSGSFTLDAISPVDGLIAYAQGFGQEEWFRNQDVPQGKHTEEWPADLMDGWVHTFEVENTWGIEAQTFGPWPSDIDLYLLYDANNDGLFNIYDNREALTYSRGGDSTESIGFWGDFSSGYEVNPGTYALVMYGYWIEPGDQFDLRLNLYGGDKLNVEGFNTENNFVMDVTPGELQNLTVNWEVPENGTWQGMLWFGMPWEESPLYYSMGPGFYIPVVINAGGIVLGNTTKEVDISEALADSNTVLTYDITIVNEGTEDIWVHMTDLMPEGTTFHEQFVQDPDEPLGVGWTFIGKWWYENGEMHYFWPGDYCYFDDDESVQGAEDYYPYLCWDGQVGPSTSGKVYIQYEVKVLPGFTGTVTNKADFFADWGESYHEFFARTATTDIFYGVFLPLMTK